MWTLLFILVATVAASEDDESPSCADMIFQECNGAATPREFPGTEEELEENCKSNLEFFKCATDRADECAEVESSYAEFLREGYTSFVHVCKPETLLYRGLVEILPCLKQNSQIVSVCPGLHSTETLASYAERLSSVGITDLTGNEDDASTCVSSLYKLSCTIANADAECGEIAKDVVTEIIQGMNMPFKNCRPGIKDQLPIIASVLQLEEEREEELENTLKKK